MEAPLLLVLLRRLLLLAAATPYCCVVAAQASSPSLDGLIYNNGAAGATNRSLVDVLRERVSVTDFGALGNCSVKGTACECADDTAAFGAALAASGGGVVRVPPGSYRVDGTIELGGELVLEHGAMLRRIASCASATAPLVRLGATQGTLRGSGTIATENPSPRGVVNIGPANLTQYANVEFNTVQGVTLQGAGCSWTTSMPWNESRLPLKGSRGLGIDSSQGWSMTHGGSESTGSCYQNTVKNIRVQASVTTVKQLLDSIISGTFTLKKPIKLPYQDRLGTNIREVERRGVFCRTLTSASTWVRRSTATKSQALCRYNMCL